MATVPDQPEVNTTYHKNQGDLYYVDGRTRLNWPYMTSFNTIAVSVSWSGSGTVSGGSWAGTFITYTMDGSQLYGVSPTGGVNGSYTMNVGGSTDAFYAIADQRITVYSSGSPPTYGGGFASSQPSFSFYINPISSDITKIGSTHDRGTALQIARLPEASTVIGRVFYIVNQGNTNNFAGVCSYKGEAIDGFTTGSIRLVRWACIGLTPNAAGTAWFIVSYYGGNLPTMYSYTTSGTTMTSPHLISRMTGERAELPNPATWGNGNICSVTTWQSVNSTANSTALYARYFAQNPAGAYNGVTNRPYFFMQPNGNVQGNTSHNMSIFFISDGTSWYIASISTGAYLTFDTATNLNGGGCLMTGQIALVGGSQYVSSPVGPTVDSRAQMYYTKLTVTTSQPYGMIIYGNSDATRGPMGSTWNRVYKNSSTVSYSALNMLQVKVAGVGLINFPLGMYPSQF